MPHHRAEAAAASASTIGGETTAGTVAAGTSASTIGRKGTAGTVAAATSASTIGTNTTAGTVAPQGDGRQNETGTRRLGSQSCDDDQFEPFSNLFYSMGAGAAMVAVPHPLSAMAAVSREGVWATAKRIRGRPG